MKKTLLQIKVSRDDICDGEKLKRLVARALFKKNLAHEARNSSLAMLKTLDDIGNLIKLCDSDDQDAKCCDSDHLGDAARYAGPAKVRNTEKAQSWGNPELDDAPSDCAECASTEAELVAEEQAPGEKIFGAKRHGRYGFTGDRVPIEEYASWPRAKRLAYLHRIRVAGRNDVADEYVTAVLNKKRERDGYRSKQNSMDRRVRRNDTQLGMFMASLADGERPSIAWETAGYHSNPMPYEISAKCRTVKPHLEHFKALPYGDARFRYLNEWFGVGSPSNKGGN